MGFKAKVSVWDDLGEIVLEGLEGESYWSAFNEKQRGDALRMSRSPSTPASAALWHKCIQPSIRLMNTLLRYGSEMWGECETQDVALGLHRTYRVLDAACGKLTTGSDKLLQSLISESSSWDFLPESLQTNRIRSIAFAMLARTAAGIHHQVSNEFAGYPYRLWLVIDPSTPLDRAVEAILGDKECVWDEFTVQFRSRFKTADDLKSKTCRDLLIFLALLLRLDTVRIECRHAWLRRVLNMKGVLCRVPWVYFAFHYLGNLTLC
jgi:hypothetical protein